MQRNKKQGTNSRDSQKKAAPGVFKRNPSGKGENIMTAKEMLGKVDHTQLKAFATWEDIQKLCDEAIQYHTASVCVPPCYIKRIQDTYGDKINICTVVGFLTEEEKIAMCKAVTNAGADFIKTSTGFGTGGATKEDVELFKKYIGPNVKIKAAGGVSSMEDLQMFLELGCDRIGTSRAVGLCKGELTEGY